jgi:hypothetical protein
MRPPKIMKTSTSQKLAILLEQFPNQ